jgi:hypothetical protein
VPLTMKGMTRLITALKNGRKRAVSKVKTTSDIIMPAIEVTRSVEAACDM